MRTLAIDAGFGYTKVAVLEDGIITHQVKEMDSIVELETEESMSDLQIINDSIYEYDGKKFLVGGNALQAVSDEAKVLDVKDYDTFKYITPLLIQKYVKRYKGDFNRIILSISYAFYKQSGDYKAFVSENTIIDGNKLPIENIFVLPQSAAGKMAIDNMGLDLDNPSKKGNYLNYLILDGGYNTLDISLVLDGKLIPSTNTKGYPGMGVIRIAEKLIPHVKELSGEDISYSKARQIIETRKYVLRGKKYPVDAFIDTAINDYIVEIGKFLEEKYSTQMNNIENIIIFGGLAELIRNKMDVWNTMYSPNFVRIPESNSEYYNVIGATFYKREE